MKKKNIVWDLLKSIIFAVLLVFIVNKWFFKPVEVVGVSMYPTLKDGERGFSSLIGLNTQGFERFDIVVVDTEEFGLIVKRVIGLPNEKLEIRNEVLYINDQEVAQPFLNNDYKNDYVKKNNQKFDRDFGPIILDKNHVFLMGDNRPQSLDSRSELGPIEISHLISKDMLVFYPLNEIKIIGK